MAQQDTMRLEELRARANRLGAASFSVLHNVPVLVGVGIADQDLPNPKGSGTITMKAPKSTEDIRRSQVLVGRVFDIRKTDGAKGRITLGRSRSNDVVIPDFPISGRHCYFTEIDENFAIVDLDSTNGSAVNHERVEPMEPHVLSNGDWLTLGRFVFRYFTTAKEALYHPDPLGEGSEGNP